jgi:FkbM family methyltransferase
MGWLKSAIKGLPVYGTLHRMRRRWSHLWFERQGTITVRIGEFNVLMPSAHPLPQLSASQPYRDVCVGIAAKYFGSKYPRAAILDIGANVGDSAARIATYCKNDLILVEPSPFFSRYLEKNISGFPNKCTVEKVFISPEDTIHGRLVHWGGTAFFEADVQSPELKAKKLSSFDQAICMVKIDTDGNDFAIINKSIDWFERSQPGILFEHQIRTKSDLDQADATFENLMKIGYRCFAVFDDPGFLILSTGDIDILRDLNRYLYRIWSATNAVKSISNYDVLAVHERDRDSFESIVKYFKSI